jgi:hypothetical protein
MPENGVSGSTRRGLETELSSESHRASPRPYNIWKGNASA